MTKRHLTIATRESPLALRQTEHVRDLLRATHPELRIDFLGITTQADKRLDVTLDKIGGKGLFVKELEEALYDGRADMAVHSMKDVPMILPPNLCIPSILKREDPRDVLVSNTFSSLLEIPSGKVIGTSSLRRAAQIAKLRPDLTIKSLRGNIHTRLKKLDTGEYDAIILAAAGLIRMGFQSVIKAYLSEEDCLPAAGQGALGVECRADDDAVLSLLKPINDDLTQACVEGERAVCRKLEGGCMVPVAAFARKEGHDLWLRAMVANKNGKKIVYAEANGSVGTSVSMGTHVANLLLAQGAGEILREYHVHK